MAKTETVTKFDFIKQINEKWKKEQQCYDEAKVEGKDSRTGKKASGTWPRDKPIDQVMYETWLQKVTDPDTGKFYEQRDKNGNTIKGTGPKHLIRQIVRIRTSDGKEFLYSNGKVTGFDALGEVATVNCSNPETWNRTGFAYNKQYDQKTMSMKKTIAGPNSVETVYEMPFNEKHFSILYEKRITPEDLKLIGQKRIISLSFSLKDARSGVVRDIRDATGILHKSMDLFLKPFDYLFNSDYISPQQKAEARQNAIDMGLIPREAQAQALVEQQQEGQITKPPTGTYS
jgi:hypothetical protein